MKDIDLGTKFGRWTVIGKKIRRNNRTYILCKCDCGTIKEVQYQNLRNGISTSCGCYHKELLRKQKYVHGEKHTRLYSTWIKMRHRCNSPNDSHYNSYGGRGIKVCDEWERSYQAFSEWAKANGYDESKSWKECSIDRIDNDKGYSPDNCRWVDYKTQANNRQNNIPITYKGMTKNVIEWSRELNISRNAIAYRYKKGLPLEEVFYVGNLKDKRRNDFCN